MHWEHWLAYLNIDQHSTLILLKYFEWKQSIFRRMQDNWTEYFEAYGFMEIDSIHFYIFIASSDKEPVPVVQCNSYTCSRSLWMIITHDIIWTCRRCFKQIFLQPSLSISLFNWSCINFILIVANKFNFQFLFMNCFSLEIT